MVLEVIRTSTSLTPVLYPRELNTAVEPFTSVSVMWLAHNVYRVCYE